MSPTTTPRPQIWDDPAALAARLQPVHARMQAALADRGPETAVLYRWLRYHLGWSELDGAPADVRAAKGIRPVVTLVACTAMGGPECAAVDAAAAIELTHEFSLVHDDLEDGDALRRGRPALWTLVGAAQAINAGDALFAVARGVLSATDAPPEIALEALRRYDRACLALAEGQCLDIGFESAEHVSPRAYEAMVRGKTGALLGAAAALGAGAGGGPPDTVDALGQYGEAVGIAFQMQDDVLGLWGDPTRTGKPVGADLIRAKKSLPIILALDHPKLGPELRSYFRSATPDPEAALTWTERIAEAGLREAVTRAAEGWAEAAAARLDGHDLSPGPRSELLALTRAAVARGR